MSILIMAMRLEYWARRIVNPFDKIERFLLFFTGKLSITGLSLLQIDTDGQNTYKGTHILRFTYNTLF